MAMSTAGGGSKINAVRRLGIKPIGVAPAIAPTLSHHAPAALITTGAAKSPAEVPRSVHVSLRLSPRTSASVTTAAARAQSADKAPVNRVHVHVHRFGVEHRPGEIVLLQQRHESARLFRVKAQDAGDVA